MIRYDDHVGMLKAAANKYSDESMLSFDECFEVAMESFVRAKDGFNQNGAFSTYFHSVMRNEVTKELRRLMPDTTVDYFQGQVPSPDAYAMAPDLSQVSKDASELIRAALFDEIECTEESIPKVRKAIRAKFLKMGWTYYRIRRAWREIQATLDGE